MGLFGVAMLTLATLDVFSQTGLRQALIQRQGDVTPYFRTVWSVQVVRGFILAGVLFFLSEPIAQLLGSPESAELIKALAVAPIIGGLANSRVVEIEKNLQFGRVVALNTSETSVDLAVSLVAVAIYPSAWALAWGRLAGVATTSLLSYLVAKPAYLSGKLQWQRFRELHSFGFWIFVSAIAAFVLVRGGEFLIARLLDPATLAQYQLALNLSNLPTMELAGIITAVAYPLFCRIRGQRDRLRSAFLDSLTAIAAVVCFCLCVIASTSEDLVNVLLGPQWAHAATLMPYLAIWGATRALGAASNSILQAVGQPKAATMNLLLMVAVFLPACFPAIYLGGALGLAWLLLLLGTAMQVIRYRSIERILGLRTRTLLHRLAVPALVSAVSTGISILLKWSMEDVPAPARLAAVGATAIVLYTGGLKCAGWLFGDKTLTTVISLLKRKNNATSQADLTNAASSPA
jgi:PST family polysaccharide transporter/lipopolysaccharide exporter